MLQLIICYTPCVSNGNSYQKKKKQRCMLERFVVCSAANNNVLMRYNISISVVMNIISNKVLITESIFI